MFETQFFAELTPAVVILVNIKMNQIKLSISSESQYWKPMKRNYPITMKNNKREFYHI